MATRNFQALWAKLETAIPSCQPRQGRLRYGGCRKNCRNKDTLEFTGICYDLWLSVGSLAVFFCIHRIFNRLPLCQVFDTADWSDESSVEEAEEVLEDPLRLSVGFGFRGSLCFRSAFCFVLWFRVVILVFFLALFNSVRIICSVCLFMRVSASGPTTARVGVAKMLGWGGGGEWFYPLEMLLSLRP